MIGDLQEVLDQLQQLKASELRTVVKEAKRLLARKPLYIRAIGKPTPTGRYIYLVATWNENGKTQQKSLGRKREQRNDGEPSEDPQAVPTEFARYGIYSMESVVFLQSMLARGFYLAN